MNKKELKSLNADLIQLLQSVRDQIDETLDELAAVDDPDADEQQAITLAATLQRRLLDAPKPLKRRYLRGLVSEIILNHEKAIVTGPSSAIAASVTSGDFDTPVLTFCTGLAHQTGFEPLGTQPLLQAQFLQLRDGLM